MATRDFREEIIYQVLVDRFDDGLANPTGDGVATVVPGDLARYQGGDWEGLRRRLGYIRDLGMTAIWISPVVANFERGDDEDGYHGYWAADFTRANDHFGSLEDLKALVADAHALGMRVLMDIAPNHTGPVFFYDFDGDGRRSSGELEPAFHPGGPYSSALVWNGAPPALFLGQPGGPAVRVPLQEGDFHRQGRMGDFADTRQLEFGDFHKGLRDLATENSRVVHGLIDTFAWWVLSTNVDGMRLDAVPHVGRDFWAAFCTGLRERLRQSGKTAFFLIGEVFRADPADLASYTDTGSMDSVFDFSFFADVVRRYVLEGEAASITRGALQGHRSRYRSTPQTGGINLDPWQARVTFVDNHDTGRILGALADPAAVVVALTLAFTVDAIPAVYYGTEQEFNGASGHAAREPMWWSEFDTGKTMVRVIRRLSSLRRNHPSLRYGSLDVRHTSEHDGRSTQPDAGLLVYERRLDNDRVLVVVNAHARKAAEGWSKPRSTPGRN